MDSLLVYGSYGYTGRLIAHRLAMGGGRPILAGRDGDRLADQAEALGLDHRAFSLSTPTDEIAEALEGVGTVLNCAGPFVDTCGPMVEACLETGTDYLDITGEYRVFERLAGEDRRATEAGITLLPGVGFDVVPSDCLAGFLGSQLDSVEALTLAIASGGSVSAGTARTALRAFDGDGLVRRDGRLRAASEGEGPHEVEFGRAYGTRPVTIAALGDLVSAAHTTGARDVTTAVAVPPAATEFTGRLEPLMPLLGTRPVRRLLETVIDATVTGPSARERATGTAVVWAEATDGERIARGRLETPEPYALTAQVATTIARRVLAGEVEAGYRTPATAFDPDLILDVPGVSRELLVAPGEEP